MNAELITTYARLSLIDQLLPATKQHYERTWRGREWCRCGECDGCQAEEQLFHKVDDLETEQERLQARLEEFTPRCADPAPRHVSELVYLVEEEHNVAYDAFSPEEKKAYDAYADEMQAEQDELIRCEIIAQQVDAEREEEQSVHDEDCPCEECWITYLKQTDSSEGEFYYF